jgi:glycosyltransferase involved in cell wall biosynthesis
MNAVSIPLLLHVFSTFAVGGPQVRFSQLVVALGPKYRHMVAALDGNYDCQYRIPQGSQVKYLEDMHYRRSTLPKVLYFRRQLRELRPDVLVTYNWGAIEWAMANASLVVRHIHVEDGFGPEEVSVRLRRRSLARRFLLRSSMVVVPSQRLKHIALEEWRLQPRRVHYIPNGIDCDRFDALAVNRPTERLFDAGPVIGTVATLRPEKNIERLVRAFKVVATSFPCSLVIAGDGPDRGRLEALAIELGLAQRIHFTGHLDAPEAAYSGFDIFALSSDTEQMPLSVLEAMAASLPVVATNVGDVADMVAPSNRPFVAARNESDLAASLKALLANANERTRIGQENHDRVRERFTQDTMIEAYSRLFDGNYRPKYTLR